MQPPSAATMPYVVSNDDNANVCDPKEIELRLESLIQTASIIVSVIEQLGAELLIYQSNRSKNLSINLTQRFVRLNTLCIKWQMICDKWRQYAFISTQTHLKCFKQCVDHLKAALLILQSWVPEIG